MSTDDESIQIALQNYKVIKLSILCWTETDVLKWLVDIGWRGGKRRSHKLSKVIDVDCEVLNTIEAWYVLFIINRREQWLFINNVLLRRNANSEYRGGK